MIFLHIFLISPALNSNGKLIRMQCFQVIGMQRGLEMPPWGVLAVLAPLVPAAEFQSRLNTPTPTPRRDRLRRAALGAGLGCTTVVTCRLRTAQR